MVLPIRMTKVKVLMPGSASRLFAQLSSTQPPAERAVLMTRAVVIGGSVAGLAAARVLSDHCDEVVVLEQDVSAPDGEGSRRYVPQGRQVHSLLPAGQLQLDRWFPNFSAECVADGSVTVGPDAVAFITNGVPRALAPAGGPEPGLVSTRPFLEARIRQRVTALPRVHVRPGRADGLDIEGDRVTGVRYRPVDDAGDAAPVRLAADLVVDATGRATRLPHWLAGQGWPGPPVQRIPIKLNYATALYHRDTPGDQARVTIAQVTAAGDRRPRIGGVLPVEGDRWMVLVAGYADDRPGRDAADFGRRCREDFPAAFGAVVGSGPMIGDVATYHQADSRRRDYHTVGRLPGGLVALGDAVASFNPIYGQGMSSALLHAACLSTYLRSAPDPQAPARAYFELIKVIVDAAWQVSGLPDLSLPHVDGPYPRGYKLLNWMGNAIYDASATDRSVNERLSPVTVMLAHPSSLAAPGVVLRALRHRMLTRRVGP